MNTITKGDFLTMVSLRHLEVLTHAQLAKNTEVLKGYLEKAVTDELSDIEKADANLLIEEFAGYDCWQVLRDDFSKAVVYTRREQIAWDGAERGEFGEILKARGGVYKLTGENKKLGRVGQKYGEVNSNETDAIKHRTLKEQAKEWPKSDKFRGGEKKEERKRVLAKTLYAGKEFYDNDGEKVKVLSVKRDTSGMLEVQVMVGKKEDHWYVDPKDDVNAG